MIGFTELARPDTTPVAGAPTPRLRQRPRPIAAVARRPLMVHSDVGWDQAPSWTRELFSRLARHHPVLWLSDPIRVVDAVPRLRIAEFAPHGVSATPILPGDSAHDLDHTYSTIAALLRSALLAHPLLRGRFHEAIQWFRSPATAAHFLGDFGAVGAIYERPEHELPPEWQTREQPLLRAVRLVVSSSSRLAKHRAGLPEHVTCLATLAPLTPEGSEPLAGAAQARAWDQRVAALRTQLLESFRPARTAALPRGFIAAAALAWAAD